MFETPSPYSRPSWTNGSGWKPRTWRSQGSRPEYEVSMCPLNISDGAPPEPSRIPRTLARPSSTSCRCTCRPISSNVSAIRSAIAPSEPVKLGTAIARLAQSTRRSRSMSAIGVLAEREGDVEGRADSRLPRLDGMVDGHAAHPCGLRGNNLRRAGLDGADDVPERQAEP